MGATAGPIRPADRVLLGQTDVLILGVGGGAKIFNASEAAALVDQLNPRQVIPVQYVIGEAPAQCDQGTVKPFLEAMAGTTVRDVGRSMRVPAMLPDTTVITLMR